MFQIIDDPVSLIQWSSIDQYHLIWSLISQWLIYEMEVITVALYIEH